MAYRLPDIVLRDDIRPLLEMAADTYNFAVCVTAEEVKAVPYRELDKRRRKPAVVRKLPVPEVQFSDLEERLIA